MQEIKKIKMQKVTSSNIDNIGYGEGILVIEFKGKNFYKYANISKEQFDNFVEAKSKGNYVHSVIRKVDNGTKIKFLIDEDFELDYSENNKEKWYVMSEKKKGISSKR